MKTCISARSASAINTIFEYVVAFNKHLATLNHVLKLLFFIVVAGHLVVYEAHQNKQLNLITSIIIIIATIIVVAAAFVAVVDVVLVVLNLT